MNEEKYLELIQKQTKALKDIAENLCAITWVFVLVIPLMFIVSCMGATR